MQYQRAELEQAYIKLVKEERPILALLGAIIGFVIAAVLMRYIETHAIISRGMAWILFPAIIGLFARYVGRLYSSSARIPTTIIASLGYLALGMWLHVNASWFIGLPVAAIIVHLTSKRALTELEQQAISEHDLQPFQVTSAPRWQKMGLPLLFTVMLCGGGYFYQVHADKACLDNIEADDYESVLTSCQLSPFDSILHWDNTQEAISAYKFGNYEAPSAEALAIKSKAESGSPQFQQIWWIVVDTIYRDADSLSKEYVGSAEFENEATKWRQQAALYGNTSALKQELTRYQALSDKVVETQFKRQALSFAEQLKTADMPESDKLDIAANKLISNDDINAQYQQRLNDLGDLTLDDLSNLLFAVEEGSYNYYISDFNADLPASSYYSGSINVTATEPQQIAVLQQLATKFEDADAAYKLFFKLAKADAARALEYLRQAAEHNHVKGAETLGTLMFCQHNEIEGRHWLDKAAKLGSETAQAQLQQLRTTGTLTQCR